MGKHGSAASTRGVRSRIAVGKVPVPRVQRVQVGDHGVRTQLPAVSLLAQLWQQDWALAAAQLCRERSVEGANQTGLTLPTPPSFWDLDVISTLTRCVMS